MDGLAAARPLSSGRAMMVLEVFVTGGTGYIGRPLINSLRRRGHAVSALAREASVRRVPKWVRCVVGNALDATSYLERVPRGATLVHLVGTPHPSPAKAKAKAKEFQSIDLASVRAALQAAQDADVAHFVYLSVAHPAPVMHAYVAARREAEQKIRDSGIPATFLRPWYVLGPGHRWPYLLLPAYWLAERLPASRETATRLGLVSRAQMVAALVEAVEMPPQGLRVVEVPQIRQTKKLR